MTKVVTAEYDADEKTLRLPGPLEGVGHREKVKVTIDGPTTVNEPSWRKYENILSPEEGEALSNAINEMFPPWDADE